MPPTAPLRTRTARSAILPLLLLAAAATADESPELAPEPAPEPTPVVEPALEETAASERLTGSVSTALVEETATVDPEPLPEPPLLEPEPEPQAQRFPAQTTPTACGPTAIAYGIALMMCPCATNGEITGHLDPLMTAAEELPGFATNGLSGIGAATRLAQGYIAGNGLPITAASEPMRPHTAVEIVRAGGVVVVNYDPNRGDPTNMTHALVITGVVRQGPAGGTTTFTVRDPSTGGERPYRVSNSGPFPSPALVLRSRGPGG